MDGVPAIFQTDVERLESLKADVCRLRKTLLWTTSKIVELQARRSELMREIAGIETEVRILEMP